MRGSFLWMIPVLLAGTTAQDGKHVYVDKSLGFRIRRPAPSWLFQIDRTKRNSELILTLFPKGSDRGLKFIVDVSTRGKTPDTRKAYDRAKKALKGSAVYSELKSGKSVVAGTETAFLSYVEKKQVSVRLYYLSRNERLYSLYAKAPRNSDWKTLNRILKSFEFVEVDATVRKLAARCGSEVEWADDWDDAARRAKKRQRLIVVAIQHVQKFRYGDSVRSGPFMDPDLADLVRERFVLVELEKGMEAPFKEGYLGPWPSGLVILFATPQGRVLRDTFSFDASYLYSLALQVLGEHPEYAGSPAPDRPEKLALAETCLRRARSRPVFRGRDASSRASRP